MKLLRLPLLLALALLAATAAMAAPRSAYGDTCAFPFTPTAYEDLENRQLFLNTIELASFNMLFPGNPDFGVPNLEFGPRNARQLTPGKVPPILMKSIGWIESNIAQGAGATAWGSIGPALVSFDCGYGVAQVTSGMTIPTGDNGKGSPTQALIATNFAYNVARGVYILADKWNQAPEQFPIAGIDTLANPNIIENWYFAVWAYNGFTGPGANRSNHPMDPIYGAWPRAPYSCGPTNDGKGHNRSSYPYQELIFGCAANPPIVQSKPLWGSQVLSLPDLNNPAWKEPLKLENFVYPYTKMDIPSPQPFHTDTTPQPNAALREQVLGSPRMSLGSASVSIGVSPPSGSEVKTVSINNDGTGVLTWYAVSSVPWLVLQAYTGVAVGMDKPCVPTSPCDRVGHLQISVDATKVPPGRQKAQITVQGLGTSQSMVINVDVTQVMRVGVPGITRN